MFNKEFNSILKDKELMNSIKMFMKCNLNLSVTSREMYIHRNTLVYRLEKIKKLSGFDLTSFEEAVIMKIGF